MSLVKKLGVCLASQQIRKLISGGRIIGSSINEDKIQPSSFEPKISNEVFVLDTETNGIFRPQVQESIYRTLLQLPGRQRNKVDITDGFEIKSNFTYLFPLEERIIINEGEYIKSSTKSSFGRLFLNTRLLADYNPCFDEINSQYKADSELKLWLLVQPLKFNLIIYPGLTLNQLRFFSGYDVQLTPSQVVEEYETNPLLYIKDSNGLLIPANPIITDGLQIHLDLSGQYTEGIIGLRARHNPTPIDLKKGNYEAENFFEPLSKVNKALTIIKGEHYLFSSKEVLKVPKNINIELKSHSHIGLSGPLHFAGFVDNGFEGDIVFEVRSDELSSMILDDGMPISKLDVFKTEEPDKLYGTSIGSNYNKQVGPRPSKYFKPFDFTFAARNYKKLSRFVLVQDVKVLNSHRNIAESFELLNNEKALALYHDIENGFFQSRYDCEFDELILQPIPYVLLFGANETIFSYVRADNIKDYGDTRLFGKYSIGVGGHITQSDAPDYIQNCIKREVNEEVDIEEFSNPELIGTLMQQDTPVDRVHFGLIFSIKTNEKIKPKESALVSGSMLPINELVNDKDYKLKYETWSNILIPYLGDIYKKIRS